MPESINVRMTAREKELAVTLAQCLHKREKITKLSLGEVMRMGLRVLSAEVQRIIERERHQ